MTKAQTALYWREWSAAREALEGHGYAPSETEGQRHRIHIEALGVDVSSKKLTNAQLDGVLAAFRAYSRPGDLGEQLRLIDQPEKRLQAYRDRAEKLCLVIGVAMGGREAYLDALARRIIGRGWDRLTETEVARICGVLGKQARRKGND